MSWPSPVSWPLNWRPGLFATNGSSSALRSMSGSFETSQSARCKEIESVIDEPHFARAAGRRLRLREAWQSGVIDATKLAVDVGGLHVEVCESGEPPITPGGQCGSTPAHSPSVTPQTGVARVCLCPVHPP